MGHRKEKGEIVGFPFSFPLWGYRLGTSEEKMVANVEHFSPLSSDETSCLFQPRSFASQCPLQYSAWTVPQLPLELPHPGFPYSGEGKGAERDWEVFKQPRLFWRAATGPGRGGFREITSNLLRMVRRRGKEGIKTLLLIFFSLPPYPLNPILVEVWPWKFPKDFNLLYSKLPKGAERESAHVGEGGLKLFIYEWLGLSR